MKCHWNQALKVEKGLEISQGRGGAVELWEMDIAEKGNSINTDEKLCRMSGEHLGWLDGAQMYEREQREIKLGK